MNNDLNNGNFNNTQQQFNNNAPIDQSIYTNDQVQTIQQPINNNFNTNQNIKPKNNKKIIFIIIAILIIIVSVIGFLCLKEDKNKNENQDFDINSSNAFFIQDKDKKYALFNDDGKQLTEFIFTSTSKFVNGTSVVKKDDAYGIIDTNGNMTVDFGKYSYIAAAAGLYQVLGENYHYFLIDGTGKVLYDLQDYSLNTFVTGYYSILEEKSTNTYKVLNYQGKVMTSFPIVKTVKDKPSTNEEEGYVSVFYNNKNFILNGKTGEEVISFNDSLHYCINNVSEDGKIITLNSCVGWLESQDETYYKFIKDGKLYDLSDKCDDVYYSNGNLFCSKDYKTYILDKNLNVGVDISNKIYVNNDTYAQNSEESVDSVDFYENGKVVKNVPCRGIKTAGYSEKGIYILSTPYSRSCGTSAGTYEYYNTKGENIFDKSFARAENFDKNGLAKVSDDDKYYYLIDSTGKKISDEYSNIFLSNDYYIVTKNKMNGIIDKDGKQIVECKYSKVDITKKQNKYYAKLTTPDSKYITYDITKKSEVLNFESSPSYYDHYIFVSKNNNKQYYSYNGKLLYETN